MHIIGPYLLLIYSYMFGGLSGCNLVILNFSLSYSLVSSFVHGLSTFGFEYYSPLLLLLVSVSFYCYFYYSFNIFESFPPILLLLMWWCMIVSWVVWVHSYNNQISIVVKVEIVISIIGVAIITSRVVV